MAIIANNIFVL